MKKHFGSLGYFLETGYGTLLSFLIGGALIGWSIYKIRALPKTPTLPEQAMKIESLLESSSSQIRKIEVIEGQIKAVTTSLSDVRSKIEAPARIVSIEESLKGVAELKRTIRGRFSKIKDAAEKTATLVPRNPEEDCQNELWYETRGEYVSPFDLIFGNNKVSAPDDVLYPKDVVQLKNDYPVDDPVILCEGKAREYAKISIEYRSAMRYLDSRKRHLENELSAMKRNQ